MSKYEADVAWAWRFRVLKAELLAWRGLAKEPLELLQSDPPQGEASGEAAIRRRVTQAVASTYIQHFADADKYITQAQTLAQQNQGCCFAEIAVTKGVHAGQQGNHSLAGMFFRQALQLARKQNSKFLEATALGDLGVTAMRLQHYDEAIDWYEACLKVAKVIPNPTIESKTIGNLGWNYLKLGDFDQSLTLFQSAAEGAAKLHQIKDQQIWLSDLGTVYWKQSNYDAANERLSHALGIARQLENKELIAISLNNLARIAVERSQLEDAERYNNEALSLSTDTKLRSSISYSLLNSALISFKKKQNRESEKILLSAISSITYDTSLRWEAEAELAKVYVAEQRIGAAETQFRKALSRIDDARSSLSKEKSRLSFLNTATEFYNDYIDFLISRGRIEDALAVAEHSRARTLAEGLGIKPAALDAGSTHPKDVARTQNAVILAYWLKPERSYLWAITPSKVALFSLPSDTEVDAAVQSYRKAIAGPRDPLETANNSGQQLYQMLVAPAQKLIPSDSRVVIIADGSLHGLNFETLLAPAPKTSEPKPHYWIEDVTISNANSLALLGSSRMVPQVRAASSRASLGGQTSRKSLLLIGNAVSASAEFPPLPQAAEEIRNVANHFSDETIIDGPKATPAAYLSSDPGKFSYIHFVAHGTASRLSPLDSAVVLSPQGDAYKLYARDIVEKPLGADLVTVSACYGSGSRAYSGEGLVGLSWAFLRAGSRNVVAALWEANDASTPRLMDAMYSGLSSGKDPASALHEAKLAMLHSDSVYRRPFYWAPFQLYVGSGRTTGTAFDHKN